MNLTVRTVTRLAWFPSHGGRERERARRAPVRSAGYARRYATGIPFMRGTLLICFLIASGALASEYVGVRNGAIDGAIIPAEEPTAWLKSIRDGRGSSFGIGVLLGVDAEGFWTPTREDVAKGESLLPAALKRWQRDPLLVEPSARENKGRQKFLADSIQAILASYSSYRRQYIGLTIRGKRVIYFNSFPASTDPRYLRDLVMACDGGYAYWRVLFSVDNSTFHDLDVNGNA